MGNGKQAGPQTWQRVRAHPSIGLQSNLQWVSGVQLSESLITQTPGNRGLDLPAAKCMTLIGRDKPVKILKGIWAPPSIRYYGFSLRKIQIEPIECSSIP